MLEEFVQANEVHKQEVILIGRQTNEQKRVSAQQATTPRLQNIAATAKYLVKHKLLIPIKVHVYSARPQSDTEVST